MTLVEYIETRYGKKRGAQADFLRDNPHILPQELTRWKRAHKVDLDTGEIYKVVSKKISITKSLPVEK